ncbi:MAG: hypothetical protein IJR27_00020 [Synergistaceae bacterium]|nr:hypothetical protein [Synergistaceae bacterium]
MTSSDIEIIGTLIDAKIEGLKVYIDGRIVELDNKLEAKTDELKEQIREVKTEVRINAVKIEDMQTSMNWHFATFAIVVAIVGFTITLAPMFRDMFRDKNKSMNPDDVRGIVRDELNKLKSNPS